MDGAESGITIAIFLGRSSNTLTDTWPCRLSRGREAVVIQLTGFLLITPKTDDSCVFIQKLQKLGKAGALCENGLIYEDMHIKEVFTTVKRHGVDGIEKVSISTRKINNEDEILKV